MKVVTQGNERSTVYMDDLDTSIFETPSVSHFRLSVYWLKKNQYSILLRIMVEDEFYAYHSAIGCINMGCTTWRRDTVEYTTISAWPSTGFCNWQDLYDDIYRAFDLPKITRKCGECIFQNLADAVANNHILTKNQTRLATILHYASKRSYVWSPLADKVIFKDSLDVFSGFDVSEVSCVREHAMMHSCHSYIQQLIIYAASRALRFCTGTEVEVKRMDTWIGGVIKNTLIPVQDDECGCTLTSAYNIRFAAHDEYVYDDDHSIRKKVFVKTYELAEAEIKEPLQINPTPSSKKKRRRKKKKSSTLSTLPSPNAFEDGDDDELVLEENNVENEDAVTNLCVICQVNTPNFVYIPCGHLVTCDQCVTQWSKKSDDCPTCMMPACSFKVFVQ